MKSSSLILHDLNPEQREAVITTEGPVLVLAGAGSGKTRVLTYRIAYLIRELGIPPWEILAVTFTKKAAKEMQGRVGQLVGEQGPWIGTFHSIFARILRAEAESIGYSPNFVIYDTDDQNRLIKMIMEANDIPSSRFNPKAVQHAISLAKNSLIGPEITSGGHNNPFDEAVARIYSEYQLKLRENHAFDFDDLITVPIQVFMQHADILEKYQTRFQYLLVDEYQDTNKAQYQLIRQLSGKHRNLCVVGDDDQSIYKWRGADISNILDFESDFPETHVFRLEQNYRSTKNILTAAHSVVSKNQARKPKKLWSDNPEGEKVEVWEVEDEREEAYKVVDKIQEEVFRHKRQFRDFAVLYRTNAQSRALEDGLRRSGMSYIIVGGVRFYDRKEVKDILAYMKLIINPRDSVSLKRIINFPARGIGDSSLKKVESWAVHHQKLLFDALSDAGQIEGIPSRIQNSIRQFYEMICKYIQLNSRISPGELVHTLVDDTGIMSYHKEDTTPEGQGRIENIRELLAAIREYTDETENPSIAGFLEEVSLISDVDQWNDKGNEITLMTLHSAKGLEFPVVFITGLEEQLFPLAQNLENKEDLEEERRLFYVGLTRAKEKLILLWARNRRIYNNLGSRLASRFLAELDPGVVQVMSTQSFRSDTGYKNSANVRKDPAHFDSMPDYESFSQETDEGTWSPGQWILHEMFGKGQIVNVQGRGEKQVITVRFQNGVQKKIIAKYTKFKTIF